MHLMSLAPAYLELELVESVALGQTPGSSEVFAEVVDLFDRGKERSIDGLYTLAPIPLIHFPPSPRCRSVYPHSFSTILISCLKGPRSFTHVEVITHLLL